jgi:hypothetical protein
MPIGSWFANRYGKIDVHFPTKRIIKYSFLSTVSYLYYFEIYPQQQQQKSNVKMKKDRQKSGILPLDFLIGWSIYLYE